MIPEVLHTLKERIATDDQLTPDRKAELQRLVQELEADLGALPVEQRDLLHSDMSAAHQPDAAADTQEAEPRDEAPVSALMRKMNDSLLRFETAHPQLTANTNRLADMLSSVGI